MASSISKISIGSALWFLFVLPLSTTFMTKKSCAYVWFRSHSTSKVSALVRPRAREYWRNQRNVSRGYNRSRFITLSVSSTNPIHQAPVKHFSLEWLQPAPIWLPWSRGSIRNSLPYRRHQWELFGSHDLWNWLFSGIRPVPFDSG